jgi:hypothetical protein
MTSVFPFLGEPLGRRDLPMSENNASISFHRCIEQPTCEHCGGMILHERWCITLYPAIYYAYQIVADPSKLTLRDSLILHSLGVVWEGTACQDNWQGVP